MKIFESLQNYRLLAFETLPISVDPAQVHSRPIVVRFVERHLSDMSLILSIKNVLRCYNYSEINFYMHYFIS